MIYYKLIKQYKHVAQGFSLALSLPTAGMQP